MAEIENIETQRRVAWSKYYKQRADNLELNSRNQSMISLVIKQWRKDCSKDESIVWQFAQINKLKMRFYTKYLCGSKTHKELIKEHNGVALDNPYYAHVTEEGEEYKRWGKTDTPCYYMKDYAITPEYFFLLSSGVFALKHDYMDKMTEGHKKDLCAQMNRFACEYDLLDVNTVYQLVGNEYATIKIATPK